MCVFFGHVLGECVLFGRCVSLRVYVSLGSMSLVHIHPNETQRPKNTHSRKT